MPHRWEVYGLVGSRRLPWVTSCLLVAAALDQGEVGDEVVVVAEGLAAADAVAVEATTS